MLLFDAAIRRVGEVRRRFRFQIILIGHWYILPSLDPSKHLGSLIYDFWIGPMQTISNSIHYADRVWAQCKTKPHMHMHVSDVLCAIVHTL